MRLCGAKAAVICFANQKQQNLAEPFHYQNQFCQNSRNTEENNLSIGLNLVRWMKSTTLFFATESVKPHNHRNLALQYFNKILEQAGLKDEGFVLYSLRHSCATLFLSAGENPKIVVERLGHKRKNDT